MLLGGSEKKSNMDSFTEKEVNKEVLLMDVLPSKSGKLNNKFNFSCKINT